MQPALQLLDRIAGIAISCSCLRCSRLPGCRPPGFFFLPDRCSPRRNSFDWIAGIAISCSCLRCSRLPGYRPPGFFSLPDRCGLAAAPGSDRRHNNLLQLPSLQPTTWLPPAGLLLSSGSMWPCRSSWFGSPTWPSAPATAFAAADYLVVVLLSRILLIARS